MEERLFILAAGDDLALYLPHPPVELKLQQLFCL
jgi:hypothetical protein